MKESAARQAEKDRQDKEARKKWLDSLSPEDRRKVKKMGLDKADTQYQVSGGDEKDHADTTDD